MPPVTTRARPSHRRFGAIIARHLRCAHGNASVIVALCGSVLVGCVGAVVDYGRVVNARSHLQSALDAATLAAVHENDNTTAQVTLSSYVSMQYSANAMSPDEEENIGAEIESYDGVTLETSAELMLPMTFASLVGMKKFPVKATATAVKASYQDIYFAIDLSSSTGMGATEADRQALEALTEPYSTPAYGSVLPNGCAFGCHRREGWEPAGKTVYQMAKEAGIALREDELKSQFSGLVDVLLDPADSVVEAGMRKLSVIGFSNYAQLLIAPTDTAEAVKDAIGDFPDYDRFETDFANAFGEIDGIFGSQGNGSAADPLKTLVLITDGINSREAFFAQSPIDQALCTAFKNKGFRLAVVEIKYPELIGNRLYDDTVKPVEADISPALEQCASSGWYFQAINNDDVPVKFNELRDQIITSSLRLSR